MEPKYQFVLLVICGYITDWIYKYGDYSNQLSTEDQVLIGQEEGNDKVFIVTMAEETFMTIDDDKAAFIVYEAMNEIDKITGDPDPYMDIRLRAVNPDPSGIINSAVGEKFDRIQKVLGKLVSENK